VSGQADPRLQPISAARLLRLAVIQALQTVPGINSLQSPGQWPTAPNKLPAILVRAPRRAKESKNKGQPSFDTTVYVEIEARLEADTQEQAQDLVEGLEYTIENALLTSYWLVSVVQSFVSFETEAEVNVEAAPYIGGLKMTVGMEVFESFDVTEVPPTATNWPPPIPEIVALQEIGLYVDLTNIFDPLATYDGAPFGSDVVPAPRSHGPDGRYEAIAEFLNLQYVGPGGLDVDFMLDVSTLE
jgi:hypothetical protein